MFKRGMNIFMKKLIEETLDFRKPCYFPNEINDISDLSEMLVILLKVIIEEDVDLDRHVRFYRNNSIDNNENFKNILKTTKIESIESLNRAFNPDGDTTFSIIINRAEELSKELNVFLQNKFRDSIGEFLRKNILLESTYFISNYKYTPFGIHKDDISNALHFNLTNQSRKMILWEDEQIQDENLKDIIEIELLEKKGLHFDIDNKQSYFLPAQNFYHIGKNNGFNVSYAVAFITYSQGELINKILKENSTYISENYSLDKEHNIDLKFLYERYLKKYKSNNNIRGILQPRKEEITLNSETIVRKYNNLKIEHSIDNKGNFSFFIRGHELTCDYHPIYKKIFDYVNHNNLFIIGDFKNSISEELELEFYYDLIKIFHKYNLLEVSNVR